MFLVIYTPKRSDAYNKAAF